MRQQFNEISGYLDMGLIYGNSKQHLTAVRTKSGENMNKIKAFFGCDQP